MIYPRPVVYLAGPMTGITHFNAEQFFKVAEKLDDMGYAVLNPAEHDVQVGFNPYLWDGTEPHSVTGFDLDSAMEWDLAAVRRADAVFVLPYPSRNWTSRGVDAEVEKAKLHDVPVFWLTRVEIDKMLSSTTPHVYDFPVDRYAYPENNYFPFGKQRVNKRQEKTDGEGLGEGVPGIATEGRYARKTIPVKRAGVAGEVRTTSATGGEKGVKKARYDLIPVGALQQLAEHYGAGAEKYDDNQWRKGYEWSKSYAAMQRHAAQFWGGEDFDEETGSNHLAAVAWHALTLLTFFEEQPNFDDRYKGEK